MINLDKQSSNYDFGSPRNHYRNDKILLISFLMWPAVAAVFAFMTLNRRVSRLVLFLFLILLGFRFVIEDQRLDAFRLAVYAVQMAQLTLPQFLHWVEQNCFHTEACIDPVMPFYTFLLTRFSDQYSIAFGGYAAVFAAFSIAYAYNMRTGFVFRARLFCWFMLLALLVQNGIQNIGGFRFNTAIWVFALGAYFIFYRRSVFGLFLIVFSIAFHYAMTIPVVISLSLWFIRPGLRTALILLILSFFLSAPLSWFTQFTGLDAQFGAFSRGERYLTEGMLEAQADARAQASGNLLFVIFRNQAIMIFVIAWAAYILIRGKARHFARSDHHFLVFSVMFLAIASFISVVPSFGRFVTIGFILLFSAILMTAYAYSNQERRWMIAILVPALFLASLAPLRVALGTLDVFAFMPSPFMFFESHPFVRYR